MGAKMFRDVNVELSDADCLELGNKQSELELLYRQVEDQQKEKNAEFKKRLSGIWSQLGDIAEQIKKKTKVVDVEVKEIADEARSRILIVRADNENEILEHRPMTLNEIADARQRRESERQGKLPMANDAKPSDTPAAAPGPVDGQKVVRLDRSRKRKAAGDDAPPSEPPPADDEPNDDSDEPQEDE